MAKKILIVEDEPDILELLKIALGKAGYEVDSCDNGRDCLDRLQKTPPDLLILDVMLPGIDGYSLQLKASQEPETRSIPIIILTGLEPSRTLFKDSAQVAAFLTKPFKADVLVAEVEKALSSAKSE